MVFPLPEDTSEIEECPLQASAQTLWAAFLQRCVAAATLSLCHQRPARQQLPSSTLGGWCLPGHQDVNIELTFMAFYLST